jgi:hypothetical protein
MVGSKAQARLFRENRTADLSKLEKWKKPKPRPPLRSRA